MKAIATIHSGYHFSCKAEQTPKSQDFVAFISDISDDSGTHYINRPKTYKLPKEPQPSHYLKKGDILIQSKGKTRIIYPEQDFIPTGHKFRKSSQATQLSFKRLIISSNFLIVRVNDTGLLSEFLAWYLLQRPAQKYFEMRQQGQTIPTLSKKMLEEFPVTVPHIAKQKQIISFARMNQQHKMLMEQINNKYNILEGLVAIKELEEI